MSDIKNTTDEDGVQAPLLSMSAIFDWDPATTPLIEAIMEALGAASVAWNPRPEGTFLPETCLKIGEDLRKFVVERVRESVIKELTAVNTGVNNG